MQLTLTSVGGWISRKTTRPFTWSMSSQVQWAMGAANVTSAIEGNATYVGPAAGKYATKSFSAGVQTDAGVGHFTASTTLTAKFLGVTFRAGAPSADRSQALNWTTVRHRHGQ